VFDVKFIVVEVVGYFAGLFAYPINHLHFRYYNVAGNYECRASTPLGLNFK